jgi:hypothetical protein
MSGHFADISQVVLKLMKKGIAQARSKTYRFRSKLIVIAKQVGIWYKQAVYYDEGVG